MDNQSIIASSKNTDFGESSPPLNDWQTLSPIAILYFAVSLVKHLLGNFIYLLPVFALSYKNIIAHPFIWLPAILMAFALLSLFAFASFKVYRYRLTDDNIEIRSGIFSKKHLNLPFSRVQNVKIEQPIYYRISGHACLHLDTAGSAKNEAKLVAIKLDFAHQLKTRIQRYVKDNTLDTCQDNLATGLSDILPGASSSQSQQEIMLNQRQLSDLVIHGITSNRIWILLGGLAPFYNSIFDSISEWFASLGIDLDSLFSLTNHSLIEVTLYALSFTIIVMLVLVSFSVLGAIISFYGYSSSKQHDKYIRRSGLLTKHEVSMALSRLQMIIQKQDWLDVVLNRINLCFEQTGAFSQDLSASAANSKIIVPSIRPDESQALINDAYPNNSLSDFVINNAFESISQRFIFRNVVIFLMPPWLAIFGTTLLHGEFAIAALASLVFLALCGLVVLRWKRWGIATDEDFVYLRKGLIGVDYYCFPSYKLQQTQFKQSLLMQRHHLATVKFVLASGSLQVPMLNEKLAYKLVDHGLYQVESSQKSWM
ncbi:PH domain-containing protein [uncultured Paraglaciecola sp.]|uniref:PH domain-containing protein n=1 Tax=uncultured Paraglaciecola sp. TaxID=1765024 RepID=UPI0026100028|nr:PH domain-containing protein [uncultured Paraglaciecola sp.]